MINFKINNFQQHYFVLFATELNFIGNNRLITYLTGGGDTHIDHFAQNKGHMTRKAPFFM